MIWILGILLIIISIQFVRYRRQIKDICRQMSFLEEEQSNKLVTIQYATKEFEDLAGHINVLNEKCRKQVWEYRQKDERLKEAITNLSHDIRTPLTSLGGYFDLLCDCEEEQDEERYQQIIRERIRTLETMLEELFTYTKLQNDAYVLELQKENITKIVCDNILSFYQEIKKRKIEPDIRVEEDNVWIWEIRWQQQELSRILSGMPCCMAAADLKSGQAGRIVFILLNVPIRWKIRKRSMWNRCLQGFIRATVQGRRHLRDWGLPLQKSWRNG